MQQGRQQQPSPAYRAFWRLRERYSPAQQERIDQAMSVLGITPEDKIWLAVTIAVDLIDALAREGSGIATDIRTAINPGVAALNTAAQNVSAEVRNVNQAASNASKEIGTAADRVTAAAKLVVDKSSDVAQSMGTQIGKQIADTHAGALRVVTQQRDTAQERVISLNLRNVGLALAVALLTGVLIGFWLHGNQVASIIAACRHPGK